MSYIQTSVLKNATIMLLFSEKDEIQVDPEYQRKGQIWTLEKKQLLIDSILNDYDIPKIYFHYLRNYNSNSEYTYSIIDGRQRLETIWQFMNNEFVISNDFVYQKSPTINLNGLSYSDLAHHNPKIRIRFDSFVLPVILVETSDGDIDLIEDMFSRLNEAAPLNSAEKRNAIGGKLVKAIRTLSEHTFFTKKVKFRNSRYQHREIVARFLLVEKCLQTDKKLVDTKKVYLDSLAKEHKKTHATLTRDMHSKVNFILDTMALVFTKNDELLSAQGNMTIYYLLFREALLSGEVDKINRPQLRSFNDKLKENRRLAEADYTNSSFELLEYDRLTQQGTNDASNIKERYKVLASHLGLKGNLFDVTTN